MPQMIRRCRLTIGLGSPFGNSQAIKISPIKKLLLRPVPRRPRPRAQPRHFEPCQAGRLPPLETRLRFMAAEMLRESAMLRARPGPVEEVVGRAGARSRAVRG